MLLKTFAYNYLIDCTYHYALQRDGYHTRIVASWVSSRITTLSLTVVIRFIPFVNSIHEKARHLHHTSSGPEVKIRRKKAPWYKRVLWYVLYTTTGMRDTTKLCCVCMRDLVHTQQSMQCMQVFCASLYLYRRKHHLNLTAGTKKVINKYESVACSFTARFYIYIYTLRVHAWCSLLSRCSSICISLQLRSITLHCFACCSKLCSKAYAFIFSKVYLCKFQCSLILWITNLFFS